MAGLMKNIFRFSRKNGPGPAYIEPSPPPDDATFSSHHEYPEYSEEFTPYPFFPTPGDKELNGARAGFEVDRPPQQGVPPPFHQAQTQQQTQLQGGFDHQGSHPYPQYPLSPGGDQGFPQPGFSQPQPLPQQPLPEQFAQQNGYIAQNSQSQPNGQNFSPDKFSKTTLKSASGIAIDFIPEESEPDSETSPTKRRGYELGTRPPPVPPKSPLAQAVPKPALSAVTQASENSAALIERHRNAIQKVAARKVEPWIDNHEPFVTEHKAATPPKGQKVKPTKHQQSMSFSALATGQQTNPPSSGGKDSVLSRGAHNRHSSWAGSARSAGVFSEDEPLPEPQPLTVENLSLFSQQSPKPATFLPPTKRLKAKGKGKEKASKKDKGKEKEKEKAKEGKSDKTPPVANEIDKGKGKATTAELDALFDNNNKFDLLRALENVDRFRAEGPEADNIAHMRTLAMLSAATGGAVNDHPLPEQRDANTSGENSGRNSGGASGEVNTSAETGDKRKMHNSFNTTTTESFGHIYHRDGRPVPPPNGGPSGRFSHHRHHSSGGALADISEATESRTAKPQVTTVEDVPDVDLPMAQVPLGARAPVTAAPPVPAAPPVATAPLRSATPEVPEPKLPDVEREILQAIAPPPSSTPDSEASSSFTKLQGLLDRSSFHDEILCQLLDAIHNRLIGEEAQKALIRAAKARVVELKDMKARGEEILLSPPRGNTKPLKIYKRSKPAKKAESDEHDERVEKAKPEKEQASLEPPPMTREPSQDLPSMLHTPTDEIASSGPASSGRSATDGYIPRTETDVRTPHIQDWTKKLNGLKQWAFKPGKKKAAAATTDSTYLPSLHGTPFTTGPDPVPMERDPTPPSSHDAHLRGSYDSARKWNPTLLWTGGSYGATGAPSHGPSTSFGGHPSQDFGGPMPQQHFNSFGRGHTPAASWSGPDGAYTTPAFTQPPRDTRDTDQTYTSPEMARAGPNFHPSVGPYAGMNPTPLAGPGGYDAPCHVERFSMPVSDEELRTTADIINGTRTFVVPLGSLSGPGGFGFFDGPFPISFPVPHQQAEQDPWDKSASIHTLYSELPKECTPPMSTPRAKKQEADAESVVSRAPTVPPKDTPEVSAQKVRAPKPATVEEKAEKPKAASPKKTPRMADLHLPSDPSAAPAIRLQAPTTTAPTPTAVTGSKSNSTPVTESTARSGSSSSVERRKWDAAPSTRESFTAQPQLPAYQSQPSSPKTPNGQPFSPPAPERRSASSTPKAPSSPMKSGQGLNGTAGSKKARTEKQQDKRHSGDNNKAGSAAPSYSTTHTARAFEVMSPETMTTNISRELMPPDHVTERLYAWAKEKTELDFVETLERLSGGDEIREFPLTIFTLQTWKRYVKAKLERGTECDRLLVPPELCDAINRAVQAKQYNDAADLLLQAWKPFGRERAPRLIITLHRHGVQDAWFANRYDLPALKMLSYHVSAAGDETPDPRPHLWWNAIARAWPDLTLPDAETQPTAFCVASTHILEGRREDASTRAAVVARNLLLSYEPTYEHDLGKLRELIVTEVTRLLERKRRGKLRVSGRPRRSP